MREPTKILPYSRLEDFPLLTMNGNLKTIALITLALIVIFVDV